jgi:hypothetical protein
MISMGRPALYDQLLKEQPGSVDLVFERARLDVQRDQTDAARERITALLAAAPKDETVRGRALEFFELHRLNDLVEAHLRADAASGAEEPLVALGELSFHPTPRGLRRRAALDRLAPANAPAEARAAALFKKAQILKAQNDLPAAATALRQAIALMAKPRELWTLLGEIETALGHIPEARAAYEQAYALSATPTEQLAADQKLFESFRSEPPKNGWCAPRVHNADASPRTGPVTLPRTSEGVRAVFSTPSIPGLVEVVAEPNTEVQSYLLGITRGAAERPTAEGWLRVARWHLWGHNPRPAAEYAQKRWRSSQTPLPRMNLWSSSAPPIRASPPRSCTWKNCSGSIPPTRPIINGAPANSSCRWAASPRRNAFFPNSPRRIQAMPKRWSISPSRNSAARPGRKR